MDWANVTGRELWDALREVDVLRAPRPIWEVCSGVSIPKNQTKWTSRLKCNVYYYITNYLLWLAACLAFFLLRRPLALLGAALCLLALLSVNDPFAAALNDAVVQLVRRVHPHSAAVLRSSMGSFGSQGSLGMTSGPARRTSGSRVLALKRPLFVLLAAAAALYLVHRGRGGLGLLAALAAGAGGGALHATLRSPNLKTRLTSAQQEFRAVWRGYQAADYSSAHDYTL